MLEIQLFGRFQARVAGECIDDRRWARRSSQSLVKLLSLTPQHALHREQVLEWLWPDHTVSAAANALNKAIHGARRALEPALAQGRHSRFILTPGHQVVLSAPDALQVDVQQFEQAAHRAMRDGDAAAASHALSLYRGEVLIDDLYASWTAGRRESLRLLLRTTSLAAAQMLADRGDAGQGVDILLRLLSEGSGDEASDEPVHLLLMQLYAQLGRYPDALAQFERCRQALAQASLDPGPDLVALAQWLAPQSQWAASGADGLALPHDGHAAAPEPSGAGNPSAVCWAPEVEPLTFRPGRVGCARWLPDAQALVVTADWGDGHYRLHRLDPATQQAQALDVGHGRLLAVSPQGDLAVSLDSRRDGPFQDIGTLGIVSATGGPARPLVNGVQAADWRPDLAAGPDAEPSQRLAAVRSVQGRARLEHPLGVLRFESTGWISDPRFSPDGRYLAFIHHPIDTDDEGDVRVLDLQAPLDMPSRVLARDFLSVLGLAWLGGAVWVSAARQGATRALYRLSLDGEERLMVRELGHLHLQDAREPGMLLVAAERHTVGIRVRRANDAQERDLSWRDRCVPQEISEDGRWLLIEEQCTLGSVQFRAHLRPTDGGAPRPIAAGVPLALSPDGRTVILRKPGPRDRLWVLDLASGVERLLPQHPHTPLVYNGHVSFFPDGQRVALAATTPELGLRIHLQSLHGDARPQCFNPDEAGVRMVGNRAISPDGRWIVLRPPDPHWWLYPLAGGPPRRVAGLPGELLPVGWEASGQAIFAYRPDARPAVVWRCDLASGSLAPWTTLAMQSDPPDRVPSRVRITPDGRSYAYAYSHEASDLYLIRGT